MATIISGSAAETEAAGASFAGELQAGAVVALRGDLGAGKTMFAKGLAAGLGCSEAVTSPTFTLLHEYRGGRLPVYHFDFYRLKNVTELNTIGFDEYIDVADGVCVIEWAERFPQALPEQACWVHFQIIGAATREIRYDCAQ